MDNFIIILTLLFIGMGIKRLPAFPKETGNALNLWGMLIFSAALIFLFAKSLNWDRATTGCLLLLVPLGNTSFLGIPIVRAFLGEQAVPYALVYDQLGSFLALATYGSVILAFYGKGESQSSIKDTLKKIITFPPFIALILALALKPFTYPLILFDLLNILAATLIPVVMIAVGYQLQPKMDKAVHAPLSLGLLIKLIIAPLTALLFASLIVLDGEFVHVSILEAGMPPMVSAGALAILDDLNPPLAAALVGIGIILSFVTLPLLYQLL